MVIFHGGIEHYPFPSPLMKKRYRNIIKAGADAVVGMHQHCPCGHEIFNGRPIIYGTGNLFFPGINSFFEGWNVGYIARLVFEEQHVDLSVIPYQIDAENNEFIVLDQGSFEEYFKHISEPILDDALLKRLLQAYCVMGGFKADSILTEYCKDFNNLKSIANTKNLFSCEAHREVTQTYFEMLLDDIISDAKKDTKAKEIVKKSMCTTQILGLYGKEDEPQRPVQHVIWEVNEKAARLYSELKGENEQGVVFADNSELKQGLKYDGKSIIAPVEAAKKYKNAVYHICANKRHKENIMRSLEDFEIKEEQVIWS